MFFLSFFAACVGDNACRVNYGGCSTLCLAVPGGRVCACADNQQLDKNNVTCSGKSNAAFHLFKTGQKET